jgi:hypothetical protein
LSLGARGKLSAASASSVGPTDQGAPAFARSAQIDASLSIQPEAQQYEAVNLIVQRVLAGKPRKGLIWHFQGSGKSLLMVFAAQKLRRQAALGNPTVIIVVDRIDLDAQISSTFHASDVPNLVKAENRPIAGRHASVLSQTTIPRQTHPPAWTASVIVGSCRQSVNTHSGAPGFATRPHSPSHSAHQ